MIRKLLFKVLGHRTINALRKIKYMFSSPTPEDDLKYITKLYYKDIQVRILENLIPKDSTFLDIGANLGLYSYWIGKNNGCRVFSFEPRSDIYARLNSNVDSFSNITTNHLAISDTEGEAQLALPTSHGNSSLVKFDHFDGVEYESVKKHTVDNWLKTNDISNVYCIKIDVEGHENEVLQGAGKLLKESPPKIFLVEIENRHLLPQGKSAESIIEYMKSNGYSCYVLDQSELKPDSEINIPQDRSDSPYYYNYWFLHESENQLREKLISVVEKLSKN